MITLPVGVVGGTGYVSGELLRLIAGHPSLELHAISSNSSAGDPVEASFPNLSGCLGGARFCAIDDLEAAWRAGDLAGVFFATPHGATAKLVVGLLDAGNDAGRIVDLSADFRYQDAELFRAVYGIDHGAPASMSAFACAVPEHVAEIDCPHAAQPGCFATAMLLGIVPLLRAGATEPDFFVSAVTGSTGSGRSPAATTHHPERHSNLYAYRALRHRHAPEVAAIAESVTGLRPQVRFVPHSGPFARGIHATIQGRLGPGIDRAALGAAFADAYAATPFVEIVETPPRIKDVTGSNRARIAVDCDGSTYAVMVAIDNLVKGAAGGAVQWMNRLLGIPEEQGLSTPGPAWT
jgi:N-acetyl-gamma-glutamyl-phosphate reductase